MVTCSSPDHILQKYNLFIKECLYYTLRLYGWMSHDHELYAVGHMLNNIILLNLIAKISSYNLFLME